MVPDNKFGLMLGLSIGEMLCCFPICGIIGLIFSILANNAYKAGDYDDYASKAKTVKIILIVGLAVGLLANIVSVLLFGGSLATELSNYY